MELKRERFIRLVTKRTNNVLKTLKVLGNCANRQAYDYTEEDINKIFITIEKKTKEIKERFYYPKNDKFTLE